MLFILRLAAYGRSALTKRYYYTAEWRLTLAITQNELTPCLLPPLLLMLLLSLLLYTGTIVILLKFNNIIQAIRFFCCTYRWRCRRGYFKVHR